MDKPDINDYVDRITEPPAYGSIAQHFVNVIQSYHLDMIQWYESQKDKSEEE